LVRLKGVARFLYKELEEAGTARQGEVSKIRLRQTHSLELTEAASLLKKQIEIKLIESREPRIICFDVLM